MCKLPGMVSPAQNPDDMVDLQQNFVHNLREQLDVRHLSQAEFARLMGVHPTHLCQIFQGYRNAGFQTVQAAARALNMHPLALLADVPDSSN